MIRKLLRTVIILAVLSVIALCSIPALSESGGLDSLLNGKVTSPLQVTFSSPQFLSLARFDSERLETLNRLIRHFALEIRADGELVEGTVHSQDGGVKDVDLVDFLGSNDTYCPADGIAFYLLAQFVASVFRELF